MASKNKTYELAIKIMGKVDSSLARACRDADKNLGSLSNTAAKVGKAVKTGMAIAATAVPAIATTSLNTYADFEQAMANTAAIAGAQGEAYDQLEAAEALGYMALAGWDVQQSIDGLEPILRLSEATQMDLARCSDLVTDSMSALGLGVEDMVDYLNLAVQTNNKANTTAENLMEAFIGCGGAAKTTGVDMLDLSTALGILANNGTKGAEAGTAMNAMLVRMTSKDAAIKAMNKLGVSAFDAQGNFRGLETVFADLSKAMATLSTEERAAYMSQIAGTNYYTEMSYLLDAVAESADGTANAWANLEGQLSQANSGNGALMTMAGQVTNTLSSAKDIFMSAVQEAQLTIGEQLAPYAQEGLTYAANTLLPLITEQLGIIIPQLIEAAKWTIEHKDTILAIVAGIAAAVAAYKIYKTAITAYNAAMAIYKVVTAASATGTLTLAGAVTALNIPVLAACAAIGLLVAGGILLYKNWDTVKAKADELGAKIGEIWANISGAVQAAIDAIGERFPLLGAYLQGWWQSVQDAWENVKAIFSNIIDFIDNVFSGNWSAAWQNVVNIFGNVFGLIGNLVKAPINAVISAINWVLGKINSISVEIPDWVPGVGGQTLGFNIPTIPLLAAGGIATAPTLAMIGEGAEPEAVLPLSKLAAMINRSGAANASAAEAAPLSRLAALFSNVGAAQPAEANGEVENALPLVRLANMLEDLAEFLRRPKPEGGPGAGDQITFSPVFNFYGGTTKEDAIEAGRLSFEEFKRLYKRMRTEEQRKSFSTA